MRPFPRDKQIVDQSNNLIFFVTIAARSKAKPTRTIAPPGAALGTIIEKNIPRMTEVKPKIGDMRMVCLNDRVICMLVSAGSTRSEEMSRMPTIGIETVTVIPARIANR